VTRLETLRALLQQPRPLPQLASQTRCVVREDDMTILMNQVKAFVNQEEGQDLLEYALLVALIALVAIVAVTAAGGSVSTIFTNIAAKLTAAAG
jgi:pilus assembly protein Flp/PilA